MASKLLITEPPLQLLPTLALLVGDRPAMILQQLHYESLRSSDDGWVSRSITDWRAKTFPFLSMSTVERAFAKLRELEVIETSIESVEGGRAIRMRVDHEELDKLLETAERSRQFDGTRSRRNDGTTSVKTTGPQNLLKAKRRSVAIAPDRDTSERASDLVEEAVERLCSLLARRVKPNTTRSIDVDDDWRAAARQVLAGVEVTDDAPAELQLERVIEWATVEQFWRTRIGSMMDVVKNADTLWRQAQPWRDPEGAGGGAGGTRGLGQVVDCVVPVEDVAGRWAVVEASLKSAVDEGAYDLWLAGLHPHSLDDNGWTVGVEVGRLRLVGKRFGRILENCAAGKPIRLVACARRKESTHAAA